MNRYTSTIKAVNVEPMKMVRCHIHNGTYSCDLAEGHTGVHVSVYHNSNILSAATFSDAYAPLRFRRVIGVTF